MNRIIIYGATKERAFAKLQNILDDMKCGDIACITRSKDYFRIMLKNGDDYLAISATDNARGYRWQYAFVDRLISQEMLDHIVFPKFVPKDENGNIQSRTKMEDRYQWY